MKTMMFGTLYSTLIPGSSSSSVNAKMSLIPAPDPGMQAESVGYMETIEFENSGSDVVEFAAKRRSYSMDWNLREGSGAQGLDLVRSYRQKLYGPGLIYFADPMNYSTNLLSPQWAAPGLIEQGWKNIYPGTTLFAPTAANSYNQPARKAVFAVTGAANLVPTAANQIMVVPIHPDYTAHVGFSGLASGDAVVRVRPINPNGTYASVTDLTLLSETGATRLNTTFTGYKALEIYITRTSTSLSTLTLTSGIVQLWPTGYSPTLIGNWIPGAGANGCKFDSDAIVESYTMTDALYGTKHYKGMSVSLTETGPWARTGT